MIPFAEGLRLGNYEIRSPATGGFSGEIYRARDLEAGHDVFLRVLTRLYSGADEELEAVKAQIAPSFTLLHPHVLPVKRLAYSGETLFAVFDYVEVETLRHKLHRTRLPRAKASDYAVQIARALDCLHGSGLYHGDLKPESIVIAKEGVKVMDAGLANLQFPELPGTESPDAAPAILIADYASPEQIRGEPETWRSDLFSWGVILYEMLSGFRPFLRPTLAATTRAILLEEVPEVKAPALDRILRQALRKKPEQRFDSARDAAFAMESFSGLTTPASRIRKTVRNSQTAPFLIAVAMLTLGLSMGALIARRYLRPTVIAQLSFRPLTFSGHDSSPSSGPGGNTIAYVSDRGGTPRIWIMQLDQRQERPLTEGPDHAPRLSPDGKSVLFLRGAALYTVPASGGAPAKLLDQVDGADWAPNSKEIVWLRVTVEAGKPLSILGTVAAGASDAKELTRIPNRTLEFPRLSADGKYIAASLLGDDGLRSANFIVRANAPATQHVLPPPPNPGALSGLAWLHGSQIVYYQSVASGAADIVRQDVETGATTILGVGQQGAADIDVVGPGSLVFDTASGRRNLKELSLGSGKVQALTLGDGSAQDPAYSPDGKRIYFASFRGSNLNIWMFDRDSLAFTGLVSTASSESSPCLSSDGKRLFWSSSREGHFEVFSSNPDGSFPQRLTHDGHDAQHPSLPTGSEWVVYNSAGSPRSGVWKIRQTGLDDTALVKGDTRWPEASPDGRTVLYTAITPDTREIRAVSMEDGRPVKFRVSLPFVTGRSDPALGRAKWLPGGRAVAFVGTADDGTSGVYTQPFTPGTDSTSARRKLGGFESRHSVQSFAVSPDGKMLTLSVWERGSELVQALGVPGVSR